MRYGASHLLVSAQAWNQSIPLLLPMGQMGAAVLRPVAYSERDADTLASLEAKAPAGGEMSPEQSSPPVTTPFLPTLGLWHIRKGWCVGKHLLLEPNTLHNGGIQAVCRLSSSIAKLIQFSCACVHNRTPNVTIPQLDFHTCMRQPPHCLTHVRNCCCQTERPKWEAWHFPQQPSPPLRWDPSLLMTQTASCLLNNGVPCDKCLNNTPRPCFGETTQWFQDTSLILLLFLLLPQGQVCVVDLPVLLALHMVSNTR